MKQIRTKVGGLDVHRDAVVACTRIQMPTGQVEVAKERFDTTQWSADTALARLVTEVSSGQHGGTNATVAVLLHAWLRDVERRVSPATLAVYRQSVNAHLRAGLGTRKLSKLGVRDLDDLYRAMGERGSSLYVVRQAHAAIRAALAVGVRWGWVHTNVALLARPPALPHHEVTAPTPDEVRRLVAQLEPDDPDLADMVLLAALTGCRRSELCALRWEDWDGNRLHVARRLVEAGGHVSERPGTKTQKPRRIALDELGIAVLERLRAGQQARAREAGARLPKNGYLLSVDGLGHAPRRPKAVSRAVSNGATAAGLPTLHLHRLRHYAATELVAHGTDVRTVANRLGHADPAPTLRVHSHRIEERDREAAAVLGRGLASPVPSP
jgi:integrase